MDFPSLLSKELSAAGLFISATDPNTKEHYLLLGVNQRNRLCHFHGWNDEDRSLPYLNALYTTVAREYAEESLEIIGSESFIKTLLPNQEYAMRVWPDSNEWNDGHAILIYMGMVNEMEREEIKRIFVERRNSPELKPCQKENNSVVWIRSRALYLGTLNYYDEKSSSLGNEGFVIEEGDMILVEVEKEEKMHFRSWLTGFFCKIFLFAAEDENEGSRRFFRLCSEEKYMMPIKSFRDMVDE